MRDRLNSFLQRFRALSIAGKAFVWVVIVPTLLASIYYGLIASDIYISEARYAVRTHSELPSPVSLMDSILGGGSGSASSDDAYVVRDYILSRDLLAELDKELGLRKHYQSREIDILSRLKQDATQEEFYEYYLDMIEINLETLSSITTLKVKAFDPEFSQAVASRIISKSEDLVNSMTDRIVTDTLQFAKDEVKNAEHLVRNASDEMTRFRSESKTIDPGQETTAVLGIVTELESKLAVTRAELLHAESYMKEDSLQIRDLRARVDALSTQIASERLRLAAENKDSGDFTSLIYTYEPLQLEKLLAEKQYASALTSLELARSEAARKQRYLIPFVSPKVPDDSLEPERFIQTLTVFFGCLLTYAISGLIWAAIKDHMRN